MKPIHIPLLIFAMLLFAACYHENGRTQHHVETDDYVLTVSGHRLMTDEQVAAEPIDTTVFSGDTIRMHNEVQSLVYDLHDLSEGVISCCEPYFSRFYYVLSLELINLPGSDPNANATAALMHLRDWGFISIDTTQYRNLALVRKGEDFDSTEKVVIYSFDSYNLFVSRDLDADSVGNNTLGECVLEWMDGVLTTPDELFAFLKDHGYDTVQKAPSYERVYPKVSRAYRSYSLFWPF